MRIHSSNAEFICSREGLVGDVADWAFLARRAGKGVALARSLWRIVALARFKSSRLGVGAARTAWASCFDDGLINGLGTLGKLARGLMPAVGLSSATLPALFERDILATLGESKGEIARLGVFDDDSGKASESRCSCFNGVVPILIGGARIGLA